MGFSVKDEVANTSLKLIEINYLHLYMVIRVRIIKNI